MKGGLVSVTFRPLEPRRIVELVKIAGLSGIEWGGDIHVPHGDAARAKEVAAMTRDAGLEMPSYGSYYRLDGGDFAPVLDSALTLGAGVVRVWAGKKGSGEATDAERALVVEDAIRCADLCAKAGVKLAFEYHGGTLTDTPASAEKLLAEAANAYTYWQPPVGMEGETLANALRGVAKKAVMLHVFYWKDRERLPLAEGDAKWKPLLPLATEAKWALIEFVKDEKEEQFISDAAALKSWLV